MKNFFFLLFACSILFTSCQSQNKSDVKHLTPTDFAEKLSAAPKAQLIDVRTPEEFAGQHLPQAQNIDWNGSDFEAQVAKLDKSAPVFLYCRSGGRSSAAANKLQEMGFSEVYNMEGGILQWNTIQKK